MLILYYIISGNHAVSGFKFGTMVLYHGKNTDPEIPW